MISGVNVEVAHGVVYHYTTQRGLEGILRSQSLRATHYKHLNDQSELSMLKPKLEIDFQPHIKNFARSFAKKNARFRAEIVDSGKLDEFVKSEAITAATGLHDVTLGINRDRKYFDPYILSFCSHAHEYERRNGLLSLWRGYGSGGGYALELDTAKLVEAFKSETEQSAYTSAFFGDVVYSDDEDGFNKEFNNLSARAWKEMEEVIFKNGSLSDGLFKDFVNAVARYKHKGFKEEQEVRAVFSVLTKPERELYLKTNSEGAVRVAEKRIKEVEFRDGFVPFISLLSNEDGVLPIRKVIVGPHKEKLQRKDNLDAYLASKGLTIETALSETPFI